VVLSSPALVCDIWRSDMYVRVTLRPDRLAHVYEDYFVGLWAKHYLTQPSCSANHRIEHTIVINVSLNHKHTNMVPGMAAQCHSLNQATERGRAPVMLFAVSLAALHNRTPLCPVKSVNLPLPRIHFAKDAPRIGLKCHMSKRSSLIQTTVSFVYACR
jgi:hypothetical protein